MPDTVTGLNGVAWPPACYEGKDDFHVFVIGDWGGMCGYGKKNDCGIGADADASWDTEDHSKARPYPMKNHRSRKIGVDQMAQQLVRDRMNELAEIVDPEFVLNVGDNFYPGGIVEHCNGDASSVDLDVMPQQFQTTYENMYNGTKLQKKEWLSVLGNHDYGGVCFNMGWTQQVFYTWNRASTQRWIMPGQYYSRQARFTTSSGEVVSADMFFLDSNLEDTDRDPDHDLCSNHGNYHLNETEGAQGIHKNGWHCKGFLGDWESQPDKGGVCKNTKFTSRGSCIQEMKSLWKEQMVWLEKGLANSWTDWQIIVTHFPPHYEKVAKDLTRLSKKYGVDLIVTGHTHAQEIWYQKLIYGADFGDTAVIISGGGGGILSEATPDDHGDDNQYGFMDLEITKKEIRVKSYSWADTKFGQIMLETSYAKCAGQYREERFGPNGAWVKYRSANGQCLMYYDPKEGWVLKEGQEPKKSLPWYCKGPLVPNLPGGEWQGNADESVDHCRLSFPKGDLMQKLSETVKKAYPANFPTDGPDEPVPGPVPSPSPKPTPISPTTCAQIGCDAAYNGAQTCQCTPKCAQYGNCCGDFSTRCAGDEAVV